MKRLLLATIVGLFGAVVAPIYALDSATGEAEQNSDVKRYEIKVGDFTTLEVEDEFNVDYKCSSDSMGLAVFYTTKEKADKILFENNNKGKLSIEKPFETDGKKDDGMPVITVYSRFLKDVSNAGDSTVRVLNIMPTMEVKATVIGNGRLVVRDIDSSKVRGSIKTGNGTLVLTGRCDDAVLSNTGAGTIQADNLEAKTVSAHFFGTGTTGCWPVEKLKVKGMMSGKLYYRGTPANIKNYSMGVKIYTLEGLEWLGEKESEPADEKHSDAGAEQ